MRHDDSSQGTVAQRGTDFTRSGQTSRDPRSVLMRRDDQCQRMESPSTRSSRELRRDTCDLLRLVSMQQCIVEALCWDEVGSMLSSLLSWSERYNKTACARLKQRERTAIECRTRNVGCTIRNDRGPDDMKVCDFVTSFPAVVQSVWVPGRLRIYYTSLVSDVRH